MTELRHHYPPHHPETHYELHRQPDSQQQADVKHDPSALGFIGAGSQYNVYDLSHDRVLKVPQSLAGSETQIRTWFKTGTSDEISAYAIQVSKLREQGSAWVQYALKCCPSESYLFGNPRFRENGDVEQDRIVPLGNLLKIASPEYSRALIERYVSSIRRSWELGCFDLVYNLAANSGVSRDGTVIISDFGEMGQDKDLMHHFINQEKWSSSYDVQNELSDEQREYFLGFAKSELTHTELDRLWRSKLR